MIKNGEGGLKPNIPYALMLMDLAVREGETTAGLFYPISIGTAVAEWKLTTPKAKCIAKCMRTGGEKKERIWASLSISKKTSVLF